jgi:hypothetical protein
VSYASEDGPSVERLVDSLRHSRFGKAVWWDKTSLLPGTPWAQEIARVFDSAAVVVSCFGRRWNPERRGPFHAEMVALSHDAKRPVIPVLLDGLSVSEWERGLGTEAHGLTSRYAAAIRPDSFEGDVERLNTAIESLLLARAPSAPSDTDDPQKGRWGGSPSRNGRVLTAAVREITEGWFEVTLTVTARTGTPLTGSVTFHLHPTCAEPEKTVEVQDGVATLVLTLWGSFTVGVEADDGRTMLELDLSQDPSFPHLFRIR